MIYLSNSGKIITIMSMIAIMMASIRNLFLPTSPLIPPPFYPNQNKNQYSHNNTNTSKNKVSETFVHPDPF